MKNIDKNMAILDEAIELMGYAKAEQHNITLSEALEIIKIQKLDTGLKDIYDAVAPIDGIYDVLLKDD